MIGLRAVFLRDLIALATRFSTYAACAALIALGAIAAAFGAALQAGEAALSDVFAVWPWAVALLSPALAASAWGREAETGLRETLAAAPLPAWTLVLGRWGAGALVLLLALGSTLLVAATLGASGSIDWGLAFAGAKAAAWTALAYLALATAAGAVTRTTLGAYLLGAGACLAVTVFGWTPARDGAALLVGEGLADWLAAASAPTRLEAARFGVLTAPDALYFVSLGALGLALAALAVEARRESLR